MMTSRERVIAALRFENPDRAPRDLWVLPHIPQFRKAEMDAFLEAYPMDIGSASPHRSEPESEPTARVGTYVDEWGSVWHVAEPGIIGEVKGPVLADWSDLATFRPPWDVLRCRDLSPVNRLCESSDKFMLSEVTARPFERLQFLRGTENLFIDLGYGTPEVRRLLDMVHEYYLEDIRDWCATSVDAVLVMDDWGTNTALLINPAIWHALFKPLYKEYCDLIHAAGKFAFFHTDGNTTAIYADLIEVGFDAINSQLFVMDIEDLARKYRGKVTFWGEIDRQYALPFGTPAEIREAVMRVRHALDDGTGGVIGQCEWGKNNPRANIEAVFKAWLEPVV